MQGERGLDFWRSVPMPVMGVAHMRVGMRQTKLAVLMGMSEGAISGLPIQIFRGAIMLVMGISTAGIVGVENSTASRAAPRLRRARRSIGSAAPAMVSRAEITQRLPRCSLPSNTAIARVKPPRG